MKELVAGLTPSTENRNAGLALLDRRAIESLEGH